jgi:GNAT superfamily N-acetyltransferase
MAARDGDLVEPISTERMVFHEVDAERWPDLERLFEARGGPKSCWCMVWRARGAEARSTDGRSRKAALKRRVTAGVAIGILGYLDDEPVAWCSIAPRESYRTLGGRDERDAVPGSVWSLVCFFVPRRYRGAGVMRWLIGAAVETAKRHGATIVEAYPVDEDSPSYRFMGFVPVFAELGFSEFGHAGSRRHVMRRTLRRTARSAQSSARPRKG